MKEYGTLQCVLSLMLARSGAVGWGAINVSIGGTPPCLPPSSDDRQTLARGAGFRRPTKLVQDVLAVVVAGGDARLQPEMCGF